MDDPWFADHWDEPDDLYEDDYSSNPQRSRRNFPSFTLYGRLVHSTARAVLWEFRDRRQEWFPRTHISVGEDFIVVGGWLANAKGLKASDNDYPISNDHPPEPQSADEYGFPGYEPE